MKKREGEREERRGKEREREVTIDERITHERTGYATYDPRCEECQHTHERQLRKLHTLTLQQSRTVNKV